MQHNYYFFSLLFLTASLSAQSPSPDHAWIHTNNISVRITPTGIHADSMGGFLLHKPGAAPVNLLSHLAPWMGGVDPAGNLQVACELDDAGVSDWVPGIRGVPNSGKIWKVTRDQILAHISDFNDNGVVDNPIPEIFSWPGQGNPFSGAYNGFDVSPSWSAFLPGFQDKNNDGVYNPESGEYPEVAIRGHSNVLAISQLVYTPFFNDTTGLLTHGRSVHTDVGLQAFTYFCENQDFIENSVFLAYRFKFLGNEPMDSTFFGIYADYDIGDPHDDYLGAMLPGRSMVYAYNSDTLYDASAGLNPPMLGMTLFRAPLDSNGAEALPFRMMPILTEGSVHATTKPTHTFDFYNYMSGYWKDTSPLTIGGTGYGGTQPTKIAYPGHPANISEWSELAANNPLGDRCAFATHKPVTYLPNAVNEFIISITASRADGLSAQLEELNAFKTLQEGQIHGYHWLYPLLHDLCFSSVDTEEPEDIPSFSVFPNPAREVCHLKSGNVTIREVLVFDLLGKNVLRKLAASQSQELVLDTSSLPAGMYTLCCVLENGEAIARKLVVSR